MEHHLNFMKKPQIGFCKNLFSELRFLQEPLLGQTEHCKNLFYGTTFILVEVFTKTSNRFFQEIGPQS